MATLIFCNIRAPFNLTIRPNGEGAIAMAVAKFIFWICATATYLHDPESRYAGRVKLRAWLLRSDIIG